MTLQARTRDCLSLMALVLRNHKPKWNMKNGSKIRNASSVWYTWAPKCPRRIEKSLKDTFHKCRINKNKKHVSALSNLTTLRPFLFAPKTSPQLYNNFMQNLRLFLWSTLLDTTLFTTRNRALLKSLPSIFFVHFLTVGSIFLPSMTFSSTQMF